MNVNNLGNEIHRVSRPEIFQKMIMLQIIFFCILGIGALFFANKPQEFFLGFGLIGTSIFGTCLLVYIKVNPDKFTIIFYDNAIRFPRVFRPKGNKNLEFLSYSDIVKVFRQRIYGSYMLIVETSKNEQFRIGILLENDFMPVLKEILGDRWDQVYLR